MADGRQGGVPRGLRLCVGGVRARGGGGWGSWRPLIAGGGDLAGVGGVRLRQRGINRRGDEFDYT